MTEMNSKYHCPTHNKLKLQKLIMCHLEKNDHKLPKNDTKIKWKIIRVQFALPYLQIA